MAIINTPTQTEQQIWTANNARREAATVAALKNAYNTGFFDFWANYSVALTQLGTNAVKWFQAAAATVALIQMSDPTFVAKAIPNKPNSTTPYSVTFNNDGTVAIS
jgi:hypothetical protein